MKLYTQLHAKDMHKYTDSSLKIALVCDDSLDSTDGVQQYTITVGEWLRAEGHDVHYITSSTDRTDLMNVHVMSKNVSRKFNGNRIGTPLPASPVGIRNLLNKEAFDVIHVQVPYSPFLAGQVIQHAPKTTAVIGTFHIFPESDLVHYATRALGILLTFQLRRFDKMLAVSKAAQEFAWEAFRKDSDIVPNVIDVNRFSVKPPKRQKENLIVFLGRLVERKGCMELLKAIAYMNTHLHPEVSYKVRIGGKGPLRDDLEQYVAEHGLRDRIVFDGFIPEEDKVEYLASADIAVFPSTGGESFGISLLEAMAATPGVVLAGDNPGYRSVIGDRPKQLFKPSDTDTLAHLLSRYIAKPEERQSAHTWQMNHVQQFDVNRVGAQLVAIYKDALRLRRS
jgi:phosphatidyl-myo-inositol alpha-mannosyltransferase